VGTVTFLFTDAEGSTRLLAELGDRYREVLAEHRRTLRDVLMQHGGAEVDTQGDAFLVAFSRARDAVAAAEAMRDELSGQPMQARIGVHTGEPLLTDEGYVGIDVHRGARICSVAHGGQILVSQATRELLDPELPLRDLGVHRLKDLEAPVRLFQLGYDDFPPLSTVAVTNLPVPPTALVGRERELAELKALLDEHRLLTLVGPGGSGKTRLAIQLANNSLKEFEDGVWWVPLEAVTDPELVLPSIGQALGVKDTVAHHLADKRLLLVLDCFEHVVDAAKDVGALLAATSRAKVLVTSRERLRIAGEQHYDVPPLDEVEAEALFLQRAQERDSSIEPSEVVAEICRRLDYLPLGIELAAARVGVLTPKRLLERLERRLEFLTAGPRDVPERQRTLRATIEWSHELLTAQEQRLFRRLGVFAEGFTLDAAEEVCDAKIDTLASLVDKSLVRRSEDGRLALLDTIHEFALEKLQEVGEQEGLDRRHAIFFLALVEQAEPELSGRGQHLWLDRLMKELGVGVSIGNIRKALDWLMVNDSTLALRLASALSVVWDYGGHYREGRRLLEMALDGAPSDPTLRMKGLGALAAFAYAQRDLGRAKQATEERLALAQEARDERTVALCLNSLGLIAMQEADLSRATQLLEESLSRLHAIEDQALDMVLDNLAHAEIRRSDFDRAEHLSAASLEIASKRGDSWMIEHAYWTRTVIARARTVRRGPRVGEEDGCHRAGPTGSFEPQSVSRGVRVLPRPSRSRRSGGADPGAR